MEDNNANNKPDEKKFSEKVGDFAETAIEKTTEFAKTAAEKTKDFAVDAYGKTKEFAKDTVEKAKDMAEISKLNNKVKADKQSIQNNYAELGRLFYAQKKDTADGDLKLIVDAIDGLNDDIASAEALIAEIRGSDKPAAEQAPEEQPGQQGESS